MRRTLRFFTATLLAVHAGCVAAQAAITPMSGLMPADSYYVTFGATPGEGSFDMLAVVWSPTPDYPSGEFEPPTFQNLSPWQNMPIISSRSKNVGIAEGPLVSGTEALVFDLYFLQDMDLEDRAWPNPVSFAFDIYAFNVPTTTSPTPTLDFSDHFVYTVYYSPQIQLPEFLQFGWDRTDTTSSYNTSDQSVLYNTLTADIVPEPAGLVVWALLGLSCLGLCRRRRSRLA
jgi:hypothetical protein